MNLRIFWRAYVLALARAGQDRRALLFVLRSTLFFGVLAGYAVFFLIGLLSGPPDQWRWNLFFYVCLGTAGFAAFTIIRWQQRSETEESRCEVSQPIRAWLAARLHVTSALFLRACRESAGTGHENPEEDSIRQLMNQVLRGQDLWQHLSPREAELMAAPEGTWSDGDRGLWLPWGEQLRMLRWAAGIDKELIPLQLMPVPDLKMVKNLPPLEELARGEAWRHSWDARAERDAARLLTARLWMEMASRKLAEAPDAETAAAITQAFPYSSDDLAGVASIPALSDSDLLTLAAVTGSREAFADYLTDQLSAGHALIFDEWQDKRIQAA